LTAEENNRIVTDRKDIEETLLEALRQQQETNAAPFDRDTRLEDAGVDSLGLIKMLLAIERRFGLWLGDDDLTAESLQTVATLSHRVHRRIAAQQ
jgi:acyl carrier protein